MQFLFRNGNLAVLGVLGAGLIVPLLLSSGFQLRMVSIIWVYALLAMGFNLLYGITGQISMGQQTFFATIDDAVRAYRAGLPDSSEGR